MVEPAATIESPTVAELNGAIRLNLGAGGKELDGFISIDRKNGDEVYPLRYEPETVDEIYASHVLEHFSHRITKDVVADWYRALKPGGRIRIAVPDFNWIADEIKNGAPVNGQGYIMGGHVDDDDYHKAIFDRETLAEVMVDAGFRRLGHFSPPTDDCSALPCSLNLQGFKPICEKKLDSEVVAVMSAPRFGPTVHGRLAYEALSRSHVQYLIGHGAYWHQVLTRCIEQLLRQTSAAYILTLDYDTVFTHDDVIELFRLLESFPEYDGLCPLQMKRCNDNTPLFQMVDKEGKPRTHIWTAEMERNVTPIKTGHFGCTMFRRQVFEKMPRPWFHGIPDDDGRWSDDKVDPDINFWNQWAKAELKLGLACRVVVGHMQEVIAWPGKDLNAVHQILRDYEEQGIPVEVQR